MIPSGRTYGLESSIPTGIGMTGLSALADLTTGLPSTLASCINYCAPLVDALAANEVSLLLRYLSHTSHIIPADETDVFALQVGIPRLAFGSTLVMSSVLALAANCRCHEVLSQPKVSERDWHEVQALLAISDHHYESSLQRIQTVATEPAQYSNILANAPLMVLYGCANHSLRVRIASSKAKEEVAGKIMICASLQWVHLIRAAHLAFTGLLHSQVTAVNSWAEEEETRSQSDSYQASIAPRDSYQSSDGGRTARTKHVVQPLIMATYASAMEKLERKMLSQLSATTDVPSSPYASCTNAHTVLWQTFDSFAGTSRGPSQHYAKYWKMNSRQCALTSVPPWLRGYVARVTSATPQRQLRRGIPSFLNRVSEEFLGLVQQALTGATEDQESMLALDIFSHWLVLVTLLDGVWWLSGIGEWELERAVYVYLKSNANNEETEEWWPHTMLKSMQPESSQTVLES